MPTPSNTPANKPINNPHDKFFKSVFTKKEAVAEFIEKLLPAEFSQHIDLDSLVLDNNEYIDDELSSHCSDVVYNCDYMVSSSTIPIKIALLFEHKSYPEKYPHLQLLRYLVNVWETQVKQSKQQKDKQDKLMPVIPIIFYHGNSKWHYQSFSDYFTGVGNDNKIDSNLMQFLPSFDYLLLDTSQYDNQYFQQLSASELQYGILAMKHIFNMQQFVEDMTEIFADIDQFIVTDKGRKFFKTMILYLYQYSDLSFEQWGEKMHTVSPQAKKEFVSTYDQAIAAGMEKGRQEGIQYGMQQGMERGMEKATLATAKNLKNIGLDPASIAKATGLSVQEVEKL